MGKKRYFLWLKFIERVISLLERIRDLFDCS